MADKPTKYNKEMHDAIVRLAGKGVPFSQICDLVGIGRRTLYNWLDRGRDGEEPYVALYEAIEKARAALVERLNDVVIEAAIDKGNWQAAMTWLERYDPERWGRNKTVTVEHRSRLASENITIDVTEELDKRLSAGDDNDDED